MREKGTLRLLPVVLTGDKRVVMEPQKIDPWPFAIDIEWMCDHLSQTKLTMYVIRCCCVRSIESCRLTHTLDGISRPGTDDDHPNVTSAAKMLGAHSTINTGEADKSKHTPPVLSFATQERSARTRHSGHKNVKVPPPSLRTGGNCSARR